MRGSGIMREGGLTGNEQPILRGWQGGSGRSIEEERNALPRARYTEAAGAPLTPSPPPLSPLPQMPQRPSGIPGVPPPRRARPPLHQRRRQRGLWRPRAPPQGGPAPEGEVGEGKEGRLGDGEVHVGEDSEALRRGGPAFGDTLLAAASSERRHVFLFHNLPLVCRRAPR